MLGLSSLVEHSWEINYNTTACWSYSLQRVKSLLFKYTDIIRANLPNYLYELQQNILHLNSLKVKCLMLKTLNYTQGHIVCNLCLGKQAAIKLCALGNSLIRTPLCPQVSPPDLKYRDKADFFLPFTGSMINKHEAQRAVSMTRWTPWCIPHGALPSISFKMPQKELIHLKRVSNRGEARHFDLAQNWLGCRCRQTGEQNAPAEVTLCECLLHQEKDTKYFWTCLLRMGRH